jgi:hypothetical protein
VWLCGYLIFCIRYRSRYCRKRDRRRSNRKKKSNNSVYARRFYFSNLAISVASGFIYELHLSIASPLPFYHLPLFVSYCYFYDAVLFTGNIQYSRCLKKRSSGSVAAAEVESVKHLIRCTVQ